MTATSSGSGGVSSFSNITSGINNIAAMTVGSGASLIYGGTGTIVASSAPASNLTGTTLASGVTGSSLTTVGALASGSLATGFTPVSVSLGGTGVSTLNVHSVLLGEGTSNISAATTGIAARLLIDQGSGNDPAFEVLSGDLAITQTGASSVLAIQGKTISGTTGTGYLVFGNNPSISNAIFTGILSLQATGNISVAGNLGIGGAVTSGTWQGNPITNTYLANSAITIGAQTGLAGGGSVALGSAITLSMGTGTVNSLAGYNSSGVFSDVSIGSNLSLSGGILNATGSGGGGGVSSISNADGTLTIAPNTGAVIASLNLANPNTWTASQIIESSAISAFAVGANGITNPVFQVNANTANVVSGVELTGGASGHAPIFSTITSDTFGPGLGITFNALAATSSGSGGSIFLNAGAGDAAQGGAIVLTAGAGNTIGAGGPVNIIAGAAGASATGGTITIISGGGGNASSGTVTVKSGTPAGGNTPGLVTITGGTANSGVGGSVTVSGSQGAQNNSGGAVNVTGGNASNGGGTGGTGGAVNITAGSGQGIASSGGNVVITAGSATSGGTSGSIKLVGLISSGTWEGAIISSLYGGTGQSNLTSNAVIIGEGTSPVGFATTGIAGRIFIDQGSGNDPAFKIITGDASVISTGAWTNLAVNGVTYPSSPSTNTIPAVLSSNAVTYTTALPNGITATTQAASDNSTLIATDAYVTTAIANAIAGVNPAVAVQAATIQASDTSGLTYNNGASGIGATFTGTTNTAITIDGYTFTAVGQRLLIKNDTQSANPGAYNGVYYVTQVQTGILPPILTRALDYDQPSDINNTGAIPVVNGTVNAGTSWYLTSSVTTVGTSVLTYTQFTLNPTTIITTSTTAGGGLTGTYPNPALANPSASSLGGIHSISAITHNFLISISGTGTPVLSQPAFTDLTGAITTAQLPANQTYREVTFSLDGQNSAISSISGANTWYLADSNFAGTITSWSLVADKSGSINIDVWKKNAAVPTVTNTITASAQCSLSSSQSIFNGPITGWSSAVSQGDCWGFTLNSAISMTKANLTINITAS